MSELGRLISRYSVVIVFHYFQLSFPDAVREVRILMNGKFVDHKFSIHQNLRHLYSGQYIAYCNLIAMISWQMKCF